MTSSRPGDAHRRPSERGEGGRSNARANRCPLPTLYRPSRVDRPLLPPSRRTSFRRPTSRAVVLRASLEDLGVVARRSVEQPRTAPAARSRKERERAKARASRKLRIGTRRGPREGVALELISRVSIERPIVSPSVSGILREPEDGRRRRSRASDGRRLL